jgi:uncharacterized membrane protein
MPNPHPLLTHFPIALLSVSFAFNLIGVFLKSEQLQWVGWWSQLSGTIGLAATVISGLFAKAGVSIPEAAQSTFESHEQMAFLVTVLAMALLLWRVSCRMLLPLKMRGLYLFAFGATVIIMWIGAWYGGELIYTFGVGVQQLSK